MKKIMNQADNYTTEMLEGIYAAYPNDLSYAGDDLHSLVSKHIKKGKVGLVTGGGSGHLPLFLGYVGKGMLDGCGVGDVFQSPNADQVLAITEEVDAGSGVLYIYGNYNGDIFTFDTAAELADFEADIHTEQIIAGDDIATAAPKEGKKNKRRGVAGIFFVYKVAGAAAWKLWSFDEVKRVAQKAADAVKTIGVSLTSNILPAVGKSSFEIAEDEMEIGMGIHGETGIRRGKLASANDITEEMMGALIVETQLQANDEVVVLVNGLGATPLDEQFIVNRKISQILSDKKVSVYKTYVGEYATSLEMAGLSISLMKVDDELKDLIDAPADTPFFKQF